MKLSQLKIDPEFQSKIPPLQFEKEQQLEQNIIAEGRLLNPIITWNGYILDGHTRYRILKKHGFIKFEVEEIQLANKYEALASIPKEERPAILEELKKKKSDRDDTILERLKPSKPPPKPKSAPQKKKPTATENNTTSQAEQPETPVQAPITESPPEEEIEPTSNAPPSFLQILCRHGAAYRLGTGRETPCGSSAEQHWKPSFAYIDRCNCYHPDGKEEKPAHPCAGGFQPGL